jgi:hypothetical protein
MAVCAKLPLGASDGETSGNTVGCRQYHAGASAPASSTNSTTHCPHAGPSGGGVCGSMCEAYCNVSMMACTGGNSLYASNAICMSVCMGWNTSGVIGDAGGATYQCHLYHAGVALTDAASATTHCPHAGGSGATVCGTKCENLCNVVPFHCTGTNLGWAPTTCMAFCSSLPPGGNANATDGNSIDCRIYHASAGKALNQLDVHCPHSSPSGGSVCGSYCENYCYLSLTHCTGANSHNYTDNAACMTACNAFNQTGKPGDTDGNTVQCRIYHIQAGKALNQLDVHCPHAAMNPAASTPCAASGSTTSTSGPTTSTSSTTSSTEASKTGGAIGVLVSLVTLVTFLLI